MHVNVNDSSIEIQKKLGIGASNAASAGVNTVLTHTGSGTTAWAVVDSDPIPLILALS